MRDASNYRGARRNVARDQKSPTMLKFRNPPRFKGSKHRRAAVARLKVDGNGRPVPQ
jgi:hypothetical protein